MADDESFELRVKRLFGSRLFDKVPNSSFPATSWSVSDGEVERREWNRERGGRDREDDPCASAFDDQDGCFARKAKGEGSKRDRKREWEGDLDDLDDDDDDEEEEEERERGGGGEDEEEHEIRASIGLDPSLDHEEEEDEYDRTALHKENAGDRVYMRDVMSSGPGLSYELIRDFQDDHFEEVYNYDRDARADHFAARVRLNEDQKETEHGYSDSIDMDGQSKSSQKRIAEDYANLKSILKRKASETDPKPKKRVRFDSECKEDNMKSAEEIQDSQMVPQIVETATVSEANSQSGIPDYVRNPSKYTCYTLDWSDDDDKSNMQGFQDFRELVSKSSSGMNIEKHAEITEISVDLPRSITFVPRKRPQNPMPVDNGSDLFGGPSKEHAKKVTTTTRVIAGESQENDVCEMDEDESVTEETICSRKDGRRYRSKPSLES